MFKILMGLIALFAVNALISMSGSSERVEKARYAAERVEKQDVILTSLVAMNDPTVNEFVSDWRTTYPDPTPENLSELREIEQRIKNDKAAVTKMTRAYKMKNSSFCNGNVQSILGTTPDCPPGL